MPAEQSADFKTAVADSRKLKAKPSNDELLELYSLFKQGTQDPPFEAAPKPGMLDLTGKAKHKAWEKVVGEGVAPEEAQRRYVQLVEGLKGKYGFEG